MSKLRSVSTGFWSDPFIEELAPQYKLLFLYLITNEKTNMLGIYESSIKKIAFETGLNREMVDKGLKEFERIGKVKYVNNYIILVNYMKHQNFNTNMKKSAIDIYNSLPDLLKDSKLIVSKSNPSEGFESLLKHFGMVSKVEVEYEVEREGELESKYYYEYDDKFKVTHEELNKLTSKYAIVDIDATIQNFVNYIQEPKHYKKYKSMYATVGNWLNRDNKPQPVEKKEEPKPYNFYNNDC